MYDESRTEPLLNPYEARPSPMDPHTTELLARYLDGVATSPEEAELRRWIDADPRHRAALEELMHAWEIAGRLLEAHDTAAGWGRVRERIRERPAAASTPRAIPFPRVAPILAADPPPAAERPAAAGRTAVPVRRRRVPALLQVAAAVLLVAGGAALLPTLHDAVAPPPDRTVTTGAGEHTTLHLADGSTVELGPASEITVAGSRRGDRVVRLTGSAQFRVQRDPRRPFVVQAGDAVTTVLGTRFLVRALSDEARVEVAVAEGRVSLRGGDEPAAAALLLDAGQAARVEEGGAATRLEGSRTSVLLAAGEGRLVFDAAPVPEVLREISRWYGVEIGTADPMLSARHLTATFEGDPLHDVIALLETALGARAEREANGYRLTRAPPGG